MANTYTLISSNVLTGSAASVTFSSIPATYTDLIIKFSMRESIGGSIADQITLRFNGDTNTIYSNTWLYGNGASAVSSRDNLQSQIDFVSSDNGSATTANTFANMEIYIPNYNSSSSKPLSGFSAVENNATTAYVSAHAGLYRNTTALTSLVLYAGSTFVAGSSFYLYGIKNA